MRLLLFIVLYLAPIAVFAQINVRVLNAQGANQLSDADARIVIRAMKERVVKDLGIPVKIRSITTLPLAFSVNTLDENARGKTLDAVKVWFVKNYKAELNTYYLAILPPLNANGQLYTAGIAMRVCDRTSYPVALANVTKYNQNKVYRLDAGAVALAHELGHLLGAPHLNKESIMHPDAAQLSFTNKWLQFHPDSKYQISNCLKLTLRK